MTKTRLLTGLVAAPHTPFAPDGSLNLAIVEKQVAHLIKQEIFFAFIGGTTGESHSLVFEERRQLAQRWMEASRGTPLKVVVHVGSNALSEAKLLAAHAQQLGAVAIAALAPSYFKPRSVETLINCCADIASAAPQTPFYYYDIPALTGVSFPMYEFLARAGDRIPTLAGLKFTNSDLVSYLQCLQVAGGAFDVPFGYDELMLSGLVLGARGAVGSGFNFAGPVYQRLIKAFKAGDLESARREQLRGIQLIQILVGYGYMGAAKAVMKMLGVDVGPARLPNESLTPAQVKELQGKLEAVGFFDWIRI